VCLCGTNVLCPLPGRHQQEASTQLTPPAARALLPHPPSLHPTTLWLVGALPAAHGGEGAHGLEGVAADVVFIDAPPLETTVPGEGCSPSGHNVVRPTNKGVHQSTPRLQENLSGWLTGVRSDGLEKNTYSTKFTTVDVQNNWIEGEES